jgi:transcriptional regulator with XRE-family HTH domain
MVNDNLKRAKFPANRVGPQIQRIRRARGWSQAKLALQLQLQGLDIGREGVAQIEGRTRCVKDRDLLFFTVALRVSLADLYFYQGKAG